MGIENVGSSSLMPYTPDDNKAFANLGFNVPPNPPASSAKQNEPKLTVAPLAAFLVEPEATQPAATEAPAANVKPAAAADEEIKIEFSPRGSIYNTAQVATATASTTPAAAAAGSVVVSDAARSAAKATLATIDAKLAQSGYSKPINHQGDRRDAVNQVANGLRGEAKAKFLAEIKELSKSIGTNFGRRELDGGKAQYDQLSPEGKVIYNELLQEVKTGKVTTPSAAPVATAKTATPAPAVIPAEKRASAPIESHARSQKMNDRLDDLRNNNLAHAVAWARSLLTEGSSRLNGVSMVVHSIPIAAEPEVVAMLNKNPTPEEFGKWMKDLADSNK